MAINILKSCKSVFAYVKNRSSPSHIRSSIPWRPPLAEILDPRLLEVALQSRGEGRHGEPMSGGTLQTSVKNKKMPQYLRETRVLEVS